MNEVPKCARCGAELPGGDSGKFCLGCLLQLGLSEAESIETEALRGQSSEPASERVGRYKLLRRIGGGGMGVVWMAEQQEPIRRKVALKVIKLGMDTKEVVARFEAERQAMALMHHPNIAEALDAGSTEQGRPFFVMEMVTGEPITQFCDKHRLSTEERLALFIQVCRAVQHAHQKGIIHRDLKPSNILVTFGDSGGAPVSKIIDFGIAKATAGQRLTDKTLVTQLEQFVGTPAYVSPEQAEMTGLDIDTRSDIYSLGVLLYELLTGKRPFDDQRLIASGMAEIRRIIREEDPPRPSTRLSTLDAREQTTIASRRHCEPPKLIGLIRGDLDWIAMKCLEKDRGRRYETANALALDVERYLKHEPVRARPPSNAYRLQRLLQRHRTVFAAVAMVCLALVGGLGLSTWEALRARKAEAKATDLLTEARDAKTSEEQQRREALGRLYDSLLSNARATRAARQSGYREEVLGLLRKAQVLDVPQKNLAELRREAVLCMGDFVGLAPLTVSNFPANIEKTCVSPKGDLAAFCLKDGSMTLRALQTGEELARLKTDLHCADLCFGNDESELLSVHRPGTGAPADRLAQAVAIQWVPSADGKWGPTARMAWPGALACFQTEQGPLVVVNNLGSNTIDFLDMRGNKVAQRTGALENWAHSVVCLSRDATRLVIAVRGSNPAVLEYSNLRTGRQWRRILGDYSDEFGDCALDVEGTHLARTALASCALLAATDSGIEQVCSINDYFDTSGKIAFWPGTATVALPLTRRNGLLLWDEIRNRQVALLKTSAEPKQVSFSEDGRVMLVSGGRTAWVYQMQAGNEMVGFAGHSIDASALCFHPDGSKIASVGRDRILKVWDAATGHLVWSHPLAGEGASICYSRDGQFIAIGCWSSGIVSLWDSQSGALRGISGDCSTCTTFATQFSRDNRRLLTAGLEGIFSWPLDQLASEALPAIRTSNALFRRGAWSMVLSPNGRQIAFLSRSGETSLYLMNTTQTTSPQLVSSNVLASAQGITFNSDGSRLMVFDTNRNIVTYDTATRQNLASFSTLDKSQIQGWAREPKLSLNADGSYLAASSASAQGVEIWEPHNGELLYTLPGATEKGAVSWLAWSPDCLRLAVSRSNGEIEVWYFAPIEAALARFNLCPKVTHHGTTVPWDPVFFRANAPTNSQQVPSSEALRYRLNISANAGELQLAKRDLVLLRQIDPDDIYNWMQLAVLLGQDGDRPAYQQLCQEMLSKFGETLDPSLAERTAKACLLLPLSATDLALPSALADRAVTAGKQSRWLPYFQFAKALAEYRGGNYAAAEAWSAKVLASSDFVFARDAQASFVMAMAQQKLMRHDEAFRTLDRGIAIVQAQISRPSFGDWHDVVIARMLMREARETIESPSGSR